MEKGTDNVPPLTFWPASSQRKKKQQQYGVEVAKVFLLHPNVI